MNHPTKRETLNVLAKRLENTDSGAKRITNPETLKHVRVNKDAGAIFSGDSIVEWLRNLPGIQTDENAVKLGQMLVDNGDIFHTEGSRVFAKASSLFYHITTNSRVKNVKFRKGTIKALLDDSVPPSASAVNAPIVQLDPHAAISREPSGYSEGLTEPNEEPSEKLNEELETRQSHIDIPGNLESSSYYEGNEEAGVVDANNVVDANSVMVEEHVASKEPDLTAMKKWPTLEFMKIHNDYPHPLHMASCVGKSPGVMRELMMMFGVDKRDHKNRTPLMFAALSNNKNSCCMTLLKTNAKVHLKDENGFTALHIACYNGNRSAITVLLSYKANVAAEDNQKHTALHWIMVSEDSNNMKVLCRYLTQFDLVLQPDADGLTPLHWGIYFNRTNHIKQLLKFKSTTKHGMCNWDEEGRTLATYAVEMQRPSCLTILLQTEPLLLTTGDKQGSTPLHHASVQPNLECLNTLLNFKLPKNSTSPPIDINALNHYHRTPLHCAAAYGHVDAVRVLMGCEPQTDIRDNDGKDVVDYIRELDDRETRKALLQLVRGDQYVPGEEDEVVKTVMDPEAANPVEDTQDDLQFNQQFDITEEEAAKQEGLPSEGNQMVLEAEGNEQIAVASEPNSTHSVGGQNSSHSVKNSKSMESRIQKTVSGDSQKPSGSLHSRIPAQNSEIMGESSITETTQQVTTGSVHSASTSPQSANIAQKSGSGEVIQPSSSAELISQRSGRSATEVIQNTEQDAGFTIDDNPPSSIHTHESQGRSEAISPSKSQKSISGGVATLTQSVKSNEDQKSSIAHESSHGSDGTIQSAAKTQASGVRLQRSSKSIAQDEENNLQNESKMSSRKSKSGQSVVKEDPSNVLVSESKASSRKSDESAAKELQDDVPDLESKASSRKSVAKEDPSNFLVSESKASSRKSDKSIAKEVQDNVPDSESKASSRKSVAEDDPSNILVSESKASSRKSDKSIAKEDPSNVLISQSKASSRKSSESKAEEELNDVLQSESKASSRKSSKSKTEKAASDLLQSVSKASSKRTGNFIAEEEYNDKLHSESKTSLQESDIPKSEQRSDALNSESKLSSRKSSEPTVKDELQNALHSESKASSKVSGKSTPEREPQYTLHSDSKASSRKSRSIVKEEPTHILHSGSDTSSRQASKSEVDTLTNVLESKKESKASSMPSEKHSLIPDPDNSQYSSDTFKVLKLGRSADESTVLSGTMREWISESEATGSDLSMKENYDFGGLPYNNRRKPAEPTHESDPSAVLKPIKSRSGDKVEGGHKLQRMSKNVSGSSQSVMLEEQESSDNDIMYGRVGEGTSIAPSVTFTIHGKQAKTTREDNDGTENLQAMATGTAEKPPAKKWKMFGKRKVSPMPAQVDKSGVLEQGVDQSKAKEETLDDKKPKKFGKSTSVQAKKPRRSFFPRRNRKVSGLMVSTRATDKVSKEDNIDGSTAANAAMNASHGGRMVLPEEDYEGMLPVDGTELIEQVPIAEPVPVQAKIHGPLTEPVSGAGLITKQHAIHATGVTGANTTVEGLPKTVPPTESEETVIYSCFCTLL